MRRLAVVEGNPGRGLLMTAVAVAVLAAVTTIIILF